MIRSAILSVVTWICLTSAVAAQTLTFPALTGRVVDEAGLLDPADRTAITQSLAALEAATKDQLVVVTLKSLDGTSIDDYGYQLGRNWQIGQKGEDNGALLIVVPSEKAVRIEVGYGLEGTLTDATSQVIIQNVILPQFKAGNFPDGIKDGVAEIIKVLNPAAAGSPQAAVAASNSPPQADIPVWAVILLILGGVGLMFLCTTTKEGRLCRGIMQIIFLMLLAGRGGSSSRGRSSWSGGGGSFGGGGSSGSW